MKVHHHVSVDVNPVEVFFLEGFVVVVVVGGGGGGQESWQAENSFLISSLLPLHKSFFCTDGLLFKFVLQY